MANFTYALGPWVRRQLGDGYYWDAPDGADGRICLGSLPDCATSPIGIDNRPIGFFCFSPDVTPSLDYLTLGTGDCRELKPSSVIRASVTDLLGVAPVGDTIADWLGYWLFSAGDPTGESMWKLGTPTREGEYEIHLAGHSRVWVDRFAGVADRRWNRLRDLLRADLRQHDAECKAEAQTLKELAKKLRQAGNTKYAENSENRAANVEYHAEKVLDAMCKKYNCNPSSISNEIKRGNASTTYTDTFSSSLTGWTQYSGTWATVDVGSGNYKLYKSANNTVYEYIYYNSMLSSPDHYCQFFRTFTNVGAYEGPLARTTFGANVNGYVATGYYASKRYFIYKIVDGVRTLLGLTANSTIVSGFTQKIDCSGTTITHTGYLDEYIQVTDSSISSGASIGLSQRSVDATNGDKWDNFEASDGIAAGWSHSIHGLTNANIGSIHGVEKSNIKSVFGV